jgi:23S rRNA (guanosine2251-2'-O)-methyltransferase
MRVAKVTNLSTVIDELKERGMWFYAADMGGDSIYEKDMKGAVGLVMGSEGDGISRLVREKCDFVVSIPMFGKINSMNVSCAAAVIMAQIAKQNKEV